MPFSLYFWGAYLLHYQEEMDLLDQVREGFLVQTEALLPIRDQEAI